jgi:hypothetical protein
MSRITAVSFFIGNLYLRLQRATVHPLMALFMPLLSVLSLDAILRALLPILPSPPALFLPFLLVTALEEVVVGNILFKERASLWARLRELLLMLIIALLCLRLLHLFSVHVERFMQWKILYPLSLVLLQWLSSAAVHSGLREREILLSALAGKRDSALAHAFRDSSLQAAVVLKSMRNIKGLALFYQGLLFCLLIVAAIRGIPLGSWVKWTSFLQAAYGLLYIGLINNFVENQLLLGEGIAVPLQMERRRALFIVSLLAAGVLFVLLAARETSLLPLSVLLAFLERLARLFRIRMDPRWVRPLLTILEERRRYYELLNRFPAFKTGSANLLILLVLEILRRALVTAFAVALFIFVTAPLLSESFLQSLRERRPLAFLRRKLRAFAVACLRLLLAVLNWWRSLDQSKQRHPAERTLLPEKHRSRRPKQQIALRKRIQMSRVLKAFLQLLKWGESRGVHYYPSNAPHEYALRLEAAIPRSESTLTIVIEILEEVLFSPRLVAAQRVDRYFRLIRSLCRL